MVDLKEGQEMGMQPTTSGLCRAGPPTGPGLELPQEWTLL